VFSSPISVSKSIQSKRSVILGGSGIYLLLDLTIEVWETEEDKDLETWLV